MRIRDLIEQLEEIARRGGDRLDVVVHVEGGVSDEGDHFYGFDADVSEAFYAGGSSVELRT